MKSKNICRAITFEDKLVEEVVLWRLTSLSHLSKVKFKSPCNFEELPCHTHIFATFHLWNCLYHVYWNLSYPLSILKVIFLKSDPFRFKETVILVNNTVQQEILTEATFNQTNFYFSFMLYKILVLIFNIFIHMWRFAIQISLKSNAWAMGMLQIFIDPHPSLIIIFYSPQG